LKSAAPNLYYNRESVIITFRLRSTAAGDCLIDRTEPHD